MPEHTLATAALPRAKQRRGGVPSKAHRIAMVILLLGSTPATVFGAEKFAPFALTGYEGHISTGFVRDDFTVQQPGFGAAPATPQRLTQSDLRVEAFLMTHSYIYHPKFIALDIGGGPIFQAGRAESDALATRSQRTLYNFSARATVLADKPYNGSLFYEHLNPTQLLSPGEIFNQQTDRYGLSFSLLAPVTPVALNIDATRSHTTGSSAERIVDDRIDQLTLKGSRALGNLGSTQFGYHVLQQASSSGSLNLPIQHSQLRSRSVDVDTRVRFGADRQHNLSNTVALTKQDYALEQGISPKLASFRFLLNYRGVHTSELHSFANYSHSRNQQNDSATRVHNGSAGAVWYPARDLALTAGLHGDDTQAPQFTVRNGGIDGSVRYERALPLGTLRASYALRYDLRDQRATAAQSAVVGEHVLLNSTLPSALARMRVVSGTVTVSNGARTQVFLDGIDYLLTVVGVTTRIQRILSGNILDGQELLVDYTFDVGGTFANTQLDQNVNLSFNLSRRVDLYLRYGESMPRVTSGVPASPLNTVRSTLYGVRAEMPMKYPMDLVLGGFLERENRRETIAPYVRTAGEVFVQGEVPFEARVDVRAAARRTRVTADNLLQNVDLTGYDLSLGWRHGSGLGVSANAVFERDTGGLVMRERKAGTLRAQWRFRQLALTADLSRTHESQGSFARERTVGHLVLRRDF